MKIVLQKFIAESGHCSRRNAEELIRKGRVFVNRERAELGMKVDETDDVRVNKMRVASAAKKVYIILNKPKGYTCTNRQFEGERNVFDLVNTPRSASTPLERGIKTRLFVVGRLDKDSRGLVLLTNDGDLTQKLTHPKFEHEKEYVVKIFEFSNSRIFEPDGIVKEFMKGVDIGEGDGIAKAKNVKYLGNNKFKIILTEGKKRQIKRMFRTVGCEVKDLVRVRIGKLELGNLAEGKYGFLNESKVKKIL